MISHGINSVEQAQMFRDLGFIPVWVEDLTEGMHVALEVGTYRDRHHVFGVVRDLRVSVSYDHDEGGAPLHDTRRHMVRFFVMEDDGTTHTQTYGEGWAMWVNIEKSENP